MNQSTLGEASVTRHRDMNLRTTLAQVLGGCALAALEREFGRVAPLFDAWGELQCA